MSETDSEPDTKAAARQYIYAIVDAGVVDAGANLSGIDDAPIRAIAVDGITALVSSLTTSNSPSGKLSPKRANLAAHQRVLAGVLERTTPLPMTFGVIAEHPEAVEQLLAHHHADLRGQLDRVAGTLEMGLRVKWDVPNIFEYFVNTQDRLREQRDRAFDGRDEPSRDEMIQIGQTFQQLQASERDRHWATLEPVLTPHCRDIARNPCRDEHEVLNLACLIPRDGQDAFEEAIYAAAKLFNDDFLFDFNGPWAPHNFVRLALQP